MFVVKRSIKNNKNKTNTERERDFKANDTLIDAQHVIFSFKRISNSFNICISPDAYLPRLGTDETKKNKKKQNQTVSYPQWRELTFLDAKAKIKIPPRWGKLRDFFSFKLHKCHELFKCCLLPKEIFKCHSHFHEFHFHIDFLSPFICWKQDLSSFRCFFTRKNSFCIVMFSLSFFRIYVKRNGRIGIAYNIL